MSSHESQVPVHTLTSKLRVIGLHSLQIVVVTHQVGSGDSKP